ncbi:MAG TPA: putative lipid II flippase FtsW [Elusimicrobiales bacterium]|nr:putative lipid II flippase FtsW [Elusimicrobiales bacterium]
MLRPRPFSKKAVPRARLSADSTLDHRFKTREPDPQLILVLCALLVFGLVFMFSSSAFLGEQTHGDPLYFAKRQLIFTLGGLLGMLVLSKHYHRLQDINPAIYVFVSWLLLAAALLSPGIANVHRWIRLGPIQIQPSEFAKIAVIIYLAREIQDYKGQLAKYGSFPWQPFGMVLATVALIALGRDLGTPFMIMCVCFAILAVAGVRLMFLLGSAALLIPIGVYEILKHPYRIHRITTFMSPEADPGGKGYQLWNSFMAVGSGGWFGTGMGASKMKLMYLPAPHTDFIFSVMAEELGLVGSVAVIAMFVYLLFRGLSVAKKADTLANSLTALGITLMLCLQAFYNMAMALGLVPTKGLPLPFFSYGGSSMLSTLLMAGILINISKTRSAGRGGPV